jgi:hypothetical protein
MIGIAMKIERHRAPAIVISAILFTLAVLILGYFLLGLLPMFFFAFGFLGGLIIWLFVQTDTPFHAIRIPYFSALTFFVIHKLEERYFGFFPALSKITEVPVPEEGSFLAILLYVFAGAWLLIPILIVRGYQFGYYLAWTFFTAMGVTELAHFGLPFFRPGPYGYFPGMASVVVLAPVAWWGIWRLTHCHKPIPVNPHVNLTQHLH